MNYPETQPDGVAVGMTRRVTNRLFENQKNVPPLLGIELDLVEFRRRLKSPGDPFGSKHVGGELPDPENHIAQIIPPRVDGPNDVAHRVCNAPGRFCYIG